MFCFYAESEMKQRRQVMLQKWSFVEEICSKSSNMKELVWLARQHDPVSWLIMPIGLGFMNIMKINKNWPWVIEIITDG